jgi:nucleoside-diphosphate-sugar epimerase
MTAADAIPGSRVFITGGAGFIGSHLARRSLSAHKHTTIYDNFTRNALDDAAWTRNRGLNIVKGDILDRAQLLRAMKGHDMIYHCAAVLGVDSVRAQPVHTMNVNVLGSATVIESASALDHLKRLVCFSTSEIYGLDALNASEEDVAAIPPAGEPRWSYAASKLAEEHYAMAYYRDRGVPVTVIRPFNIYGPGQIGQGAVANFIRAGLRHEPLQVRAGGHQIRAWCFVDDFIEGVLLAAGAKKAIGEIFNIGNPKAIETTLGLAKRVLAQLDSRSTIEHVDGGAEVEKRVPNITKAMNLLGYKPQIELDEGITHSITWFRERSP